MAMASEYGSSPVAAPGAPDADGLARDRREMISGSTSESRNAQAAGSRKNAGQVDQERVEQGGELVDVGLEQVLVRADRLEPDVLHAPPHTALDGGALVPREVEPTGVPDEMQELLEALAAPSGTVRVARLRTRARRALAVAPQRSLLRARP